MATLKSIKGNNVLDGSSKNKGVTFEKTVLYLP